VDILMMGGFCLILEDGIPLIQIAVWKQNANKSYLDCVKYLVQGTILLTKHNGVSIQRWQLGKNNKIWFTSTLDMNVFVIGYEHVLESWFNTYGSWGLFDQKTNAYPTKGIEK
jgi:hypothetical protein